MPDRFAAAIDEEDWTGTKPVQFSCHRDLRRARHARGNGGPAILTFWTEQVICSGDPADYLEVNMDGTQLWVTTATDPACGRVGYRQIALDVSAYADNAAHTLEFNSEIFGSALTNFFVDDVVLGSGDGGVCSNLSDVPWLSEVPTNGTTIPGGSTPVQVTFDSTGVAAGTYTANLCIDRLSVDITNNGGATWTTVRLYTTDQGVLQGLPGVNVTLDLDPWAGQANLMLRWRYYSTASSPGWYAQVDEVKIRCSAPPPTAVSLATLDAATNSPLPVPAGLPLAALPAVASLALGAAYVLRRRGK